MAAVTELLCYNKGCGKTFKEEDNSDDACAYHPGDPVFHDAMKGWSCCKKRSTDFTDFLNMPGCTRSRHNPVKPAQPVKPLIEPLGKGEVIEVKAPPPPKPKVPVQRPSEDQPHTDLKTTVSNSLKSALARYKKVEEEKQKTSPTNSTDEEEVVIGTKCHRSGCETTYKGSETNLTDCIFHPGIPIFHEGYKFWSCCRRRTSDFNEFLRQEGCKTGNHSWKPSEDNTKSARCDWHQTGSQVIISVFSKCCVPEECHVTANCTTVNCHLSFEGGNKTFQRVWNLEGVIEPSKSSVKLLGTKAEIELRKADGTPWKWLELKKEAPTAPAAVEEKPTSNGEEEN